MKKSILALFLLSVLGLAGCGQTGGLYMPEETQTNEQSS
ncbi:LPS translocon maturation chaperone LptM [Vibrio scophthalmi]